MVNQRRLRPVFVAARRLSTGRGRACPLERESECGPAITLSGSTIPLRCIGVGEAQDSPTQPMVVHLV